MSYGYDNDSYRPSTSGLVAASAVSVGHQQAFPRGHPYSQPTNCYNAPNSYYSPQQGYSQVHSQIYYAPPPPPLIQSAGPSYSGRNGSGTGSRGRDYLLSLTTDISNVNLNPNLAINKHRAASYPSTSNTNGDIPINGSPNYNKRLPPLPLPPPPVPPVYSTSIGSPSSLKYSHQSYPYTTSYLNQNDTTMAYSECRIPIASSSSSSKYTLSAPPPPLPPRPISEPAPNPNSIDQSRTLTQTKPTGIASASTSPKTFRPSVHPHSQPRISEESHLRPPNPRTPNRPHSDPPVRTSSGKKIDSESTSKKKEKGVEKLKSANKGKVKDTRKVKSRSDSDGEKEWTPKRTSIIDLTLSDSDSYSDNSTSTSSESDTNLDVNSSTRKITPRSNARRRRAISEQPLRQTPGISTPTTKRLSSRPVGSPSINSSGRGKATQCSGFTRSGQPCKRLVKVEAPFLVRDPNLPSGDGEGDERSQRVLGRYCKDHAGMICQVGGFYWRGERQRSDVWIDFDEFIPPDLGQQTQTLLRMTMESKLTAKESPGFLYAYELKDLETDTLAFYKVGRTDNVPRRIGQWTHQCQSKTPTLRDIFPLPSQSLTSTSRSNNSNLQRSGTLTTSYLPGATTHRTPPSLAMKRWERLVHLELSDRCASHEVSLKAYEKVREKCGDCGLGHREIFPLVKSVEGKDAYEGVVVEVVGRWERFIKKICQG